MSKVAVTKSLLDNLAASVSHKSGEDLPLTIEEMTDAVDGIEVVNNQARTVNPGTTSFTVTPMAGYTGLSEVTVNAMPSGTVTAPASVSATGATLGYSPSNNTITLSKTVSVTPSVTTAGYVSSGTAGNSDVSLTASANIRSSSDLSANGATVTAPSGYYPSSASASVASGTEGVPTLTVGSLYRGERRIYSSVTNTAGYINGGTLESDSIYLSANSFVSGSYNITENDTYDVTDLAEVVVQVEPNLQAKTNITPTTSSQTITADQNYDGLSSVQINAMPSGTAGTPTATKGTVSNHSVSVTPSVTNTAGYISGGTQTGTAVSVSASELVSGTYTVSSSGTADVTNYASVSVPSGSLATASWVRGKSNGYYIVKHEIDKTAGMIESGQQEFSNKTFMTLENLSVTPSSSQQVVTPSSQAHYLDSVTVNAVPSGTAGTPTATKGTVSNHSVSVTPSVTNTTGYITGSTINGTAVTVSASELVSGTYNVSSSGTADVTNYASVSVPSLTSDDYTEGLTKLYYTVSGQRKWIVGGVIDILNTGLVEEYQRLFVSEETYNAIPTGTTITPSTSAQTIGGANYMMEGAVTVSGDANLVAGNIKKNVSIFGVTGSYEGGGGGSVQVGLADSEPETQTRSISFTGLNGEPTSFAVFTNGSLTPGATSQVAAVVFDGTGLHGQTITNTSNAQVTYDSSSFSKSYSNGTLTVTSTGPYFTTGYYLIYTYGGGSGSIDTKDVQVGSGATSITFTGLEDEPIWWSCIFKSNFGSSSGYQRVIFTTDFIGDGIGGLEMDSQAAYSSHWNSTYSNGSLTITSNSASSGGYFHQPGYYQLTYAYSSSGNYQNKTVTPTTSIQQITADSGYDALRRVTVNAMPEMTLPNSASATSSGTSKATITPTSSVQYLNIPTGYNATAQYYTIGASGGGGSVSVGTKTTTNQSATATSITFTQLSGAPKAFFVRCTSNLSRSSSNRYYYVADMRWDGSSTGGVEGNRYYVYNGQYSNVTSGYSQSYSNGTLTLTSSGGQSTSPGSFYNGTYELVYVY